MFRKPHHNRRGLSQLFRQKPSCKWRRPKSEKWDCPPLRRLGTSSIEALVAFTLLSTALSVSLPLVVRHGRLLESCRHYRLALDELSNQLDRMTQLPEADARAAIAKLTPSTFITSKLPSVKLAGEMRSADMGSRLTLFIWWSDLPNHPTTLSMAAWIFPTGETARATQGDHEP